MKNKNIQNFLVTILFFFLFFSSSCQQFSQFDLWPEPHLVESNNSNVKQYIVNSYKLYYTLQNHQTDQLLKSLIDDTVQLYYRTQFKNFQQKYQEETTSNTELEVIITIKNNTITHMSENTNESYILDVQENTESDANIKPVKIILTSENYFGFLRGFETLRQLMNCQFNQATNKEVCGFKNLPIKITDQPDYSYRGVMVDTGRHFIPKKDIIRTLDAMMYNKMNVFHWHITDSQSFPIELPSHPNIAKGGAFSENEIYTAQDIREIVWHALKRGVRIVPEIDLPGHCQSMGLHPDYLYLLKCGNFDVISDMAYQTLQDIMNDLNDLFPENLVHLGGDEVFLSCIQQTDEKTNQIMQDNNITEVQNLRYYFRERQKRMLKKQKKAVYWYHDNEGGQFEPDDVIQLWSGLSSVSSLKKFTNKIILSPIDYLYMNCGIGGECGGYISFSQVANFNPAQTGDIPKDQILGAETCLWGEWSNEKSLDIRLWVRSSALAQRLWNNKIFEKNGYDQRTVVTRLASMEKRMLQRGIGAAPVTCEYCSRHVNECF